MDVTMKVYAAVIHDQEIGATWFASLDGESFIGVSRKPYADDGPLVEELMNPTKPGAMMPMRIHRGALEAQGAEFWIPTEEDE